MSRRSEIEATPLLFSPDESSRLLNAEEAIKPSWLKEKARRREIPHCLVAGKVMFTADHLAEIIHKFERRPAAQVTTPGRKVTAPRAAKEQGKAPNTEPGKGDTLTARAPRRKRAAQQDGRPRQAGRGRPSENTTGG